MEFDLAFIGQQLGAQVGMLAQLRGGISFASSELQKVIAEGEMMTTMHMSEAKKIMEQLKATKPASVKQSTLRKVVQLHAMNLEHWDGGGSVSRIIASQSVTPLRHSLVAKSQLFPGVARGYTCPAASRGGEELMR